MTKLLFPLAWFALFFMVGPLGSQPSETTTQKSGGPGKPLTPQEAQKLFQLPKGLRIELVACEPQIESPVAMAFAPDGKLWVVEMRDYPNGPKTGEKPGGRIRVLEDKDGDGFYETSTVWADNLLFANGLLLWDMGVIVTAAPHILYIEDDKGKAGKRTILFEGFAAENPQLRLSNPILGLDGWIYCANGLRGGKVVNPRDPKAKPIDLSGMDFRFNMLTGQAEAISGLGQYGNTFDDWGNRFVCDNRHHLRHIVIENRYLKRNPNLAALGVVEDISILEDGPLSSGGKIYPLSKNWTTSTLHEGRFTAACGVFIYRGQLLGKPYGGAAFTCDPTGNLVHGESMEQKGATYQSKPFEKGKEFLASPDDWFRPVFLTHGPDDAMYVVDMYRAVIEHPEFMPPELQKRPDLTAGKDKGRIWRIVPEKHNSLKARRSFKAKPTLQDKLEALKSPEPWQRLTAQHLLQIDKPGLGPDVLGKIGQFATDHSRHDFLIQQLAWLGLTGSTGISTLNHNNNPRLRENGILLLEKTNFNDGNWPDIIQIFAKDPDPRVRFQAALTLGELKLDKRIVDASRIVDSLAEIALAGAEDRWTRLAVESSLAGKAEPFLRRLVRDQFESKITAGNVELVREVATLTAAEGNALQAVGHAEKMHQAPQWQLAIAVGLAEGLARKGKNISSEINGKIPEYLVPSRRWFFEELLPRTRKQALDGKLPVGERLIALKLFNQDKWEVVNKPLSALLNDDPALEIRLAAVRSLGSFANEEAAKVLVENWRSHGPAVRREIIEAMFRDQQRIGIFLDEIEAKRIKGGDLDPLRARQLLNHPNKDLRARAEKLLKNHLPADRAQVLARYQPALTMKGDGKRGQEIFKKNCATCHRVHGIGIDVGPDIADTRTKTLSALLTDILNPNAAIDANYVNYVVVTKTGRTITGLLTNETAASITLKRAEGQTDVVLRQDIDELQSSGISLMPEGLEKTITIAEMADLLSFLKNWRYLDGTVPLTPR